MVHKKIFDAWMNRCVENLGSDVDLFNFHESKKGKFRQNTVKISVNNCNHLLLSAQTSELLGR